MILSKAGTSCYYALLYEELKAKEIKQ